MRRHDSSTVGFKHSVAAHKMSLTVEKEASTGKLVVVDDKLKRKRFRLDMKTPTSGVFYAPPMIFQPSTARLPAFWAHGDNEIEGDLEEFEEV